MNELLFKLSCHDIKQTPRNTTVKSVIFKSEYFYEDNALQLMLARASLMRAECNYLPWMPAVSV